MSEVVTDGVVLTLAELRATLRTRKKEGNVGSYHSAVRSLKVAEADGVMFLCPYCYLIEPRGPVGTHGVICWFAGRVGSDVTPKPGRWSPQGERLEQLTFVPWKEGETTHSQSVQLNDGCCAHFEVVDGKVLRITGKAP